MTWLELKPLLTVLIPLLAAGAIALTGRIPRLREFWSFLAGGACWLLMVSMLRDLLGGTAAGGVVWPLLPDMPLALRADEFGLVFGLVSSTLWIATTCYSVGYTRGLKMPGQTRFFAVFALCIGSTFLIALAANMLTFLIGYEMLTIATYPLVVHEGSLQARRAGRLYLCYTLPAGAALLGATAWSYLAAGHVTFAPGGFLPTGLPAGALIGIFALYVLGFGVKSGLMPIHAWLPEAMIAPTPVSALLHAVAVVKAGVFGFLRLIYFIVGPDTLASSGLWLPLAAASAATIICSSLIAFFQDEIKRRLAYSTIGHLSYIVLGACLLAPAAQVGALLHLMNHAMMKITLFFCAGAIHVAAHKDRVSQIGGLGRHMPWTFGAFAVTALGLAGVPGLCGFVSKWWLCYGAVQTGQYWVIAVLLLSGVLNVAYLLPIAVKGFGRHSAEGAGAQHHNHGEAPFAMLAPILFTAGLSLALGLVIPALSAQIEFAQRAVVR